MIFIDMTDKKRVIKDFEKLNDQLKEQVIELLQNGVAESSITYLSQNNQKVKALPFETEDTRYLIKFSEQAIEDIDELDFDPWEESDFDDDDYVDLDDDSMDYNREPSSDD